MKTSKIRKDKTINRKKQNFTIKDYRAIEMIKRESDSCTQH